MMDLTTEKALLIIRKEQEIRNKTYQSMIDDLFEYFSIGEMYNAEVDTMIGIFDKHKRQDLIDLVLQYRKDNRG